MEEVFYRPPKILIGGYARHGKDFLAELFVKFSLGEDLKWASSSSSYFYIKKHFEYLQSKFGYSNIGEAYKDRINHRSFYYDSICDYNKDDPSRLSRELLEHYNIYVGMRDHIEFVNSKELFDITIWVNADLRQPIESGDSCNINRNDFDIVVDNNSSLQALMIKAGRLFKIIAL